MVAVEVVEVVGLLSVFSVFVAVVLIGETAYVPHVPYVKTEDFVRAAAYSISELEVSLATVRLDLDKTFKKIKVIFIKCN